MSPSSLLSLLFIAACSALPLWAANDGQLGAQSSGSAAFSFDVSNLVKLTGITDVSFDNYSGQGDPEADRRVCVYTNNAAGTYRVTALGNLNVSGGAGTDFYVHMGARTIPYQVRWNDEPANGGVNLTANQPLAGQTGANTLSQSCGSGTNANFQIRFQKHNILSVPAGTYSGVLQLVIAPN